ncbi:MAG: serine/threonine-protein kinase, partial [Nannocystaceae bacterium]
MARSKKPQGTDAKSHPVAPLAATTDDDPRIDATVLLSDALETDATLAPPSQPSHPIVTTRAGPSFETDATLAPPHKLPTSVALPPNDRSLETGLTLALRSDAPSPGSAIEIDATLAPPSKEVLETGATVASTGLPPPTHADAGTLPVGAKIGRLMILRTLGAGGMGVVYAAYDPELDRNVALKLIRAGKASQMAQLRLYREAQALAKLNHPNVVSVHDVGKHAGQVWLAMEFVDGVTLGDWVEREKPGWHDVLEVLKQAALGVSAAHAAGLLHRDLKPDNIFLDEPEPGRVLVKLMDFG